MEGSRFVNCSVRYRPKENNACCAAKRIDGSVKDDTILINETKCPTMHAVISHVGNVSLYQTGCPCDTESNRRQADYVRNPETHQNSRRLA